MNSQNPDSLPKFGSPWDQYSIRDPFTIYDNLSSLGITTLPISEGPVRMRNVPDETATGLFQIYLPETESYSHILWDGLPTGIECRALDDYSRSLFAKHWTELCNKWPAPNFLTIELPNGVIAKLSLYFSGTLFSCKVEYLTPLEPDADIDRSIDPTLIDLFRRHQIKKHYTLTFNFSESQIAASKVIVQECNSEPEAVRTKLTEAKALAKPEGVVRHAGFELETSGSNFLGLREELQTLAPELVSATEEASSVQFAVPSLDFEVVLDIIDDAGYKRQLLEPFMRSQKDAKTDFVLQVPAWVYFKVMERLKTDNSVLYTRLFERNMTSNTVIKVGSLPFHRQQLSLIPSEVAGLNDLLGLNIEG